MSHLRLCGGSTPDLDPAPDPYLGCTFWPEFSLYWYYVNPMLSSKFNILSYNSSTWSDLNNSFTSRGNFFSGWSFWEPTTLCCLQNWISCPIMLFQVVRIEKFIHKQGSFFPDNHFEYLQHYVIFKIEHFPHNSVPSCQIWKFLHKQGFFFRLLF